MLSSLAYIVRIYLRLQLLNIRAQMEYRTDFLIGVLGVLLLHGTSLVFLWAIFSYVPTVEGWSAWQVAVVFSLVTLPRGLADLLFAGHWRLRFLVNRAEFDFLLLRPYPSALMVLGHTSNIHGIGTVLLGLITLVVAGGQAPIAWNVGSIIYVIAIILNSCIIILCVNFAANCMVFWEPSADSSLPFFFNNATELVKFPITIYAPAIQFVLTYVLPFAFISHVPSTCILGKQPNISNCFVPFPVGIVAIAVLIVVWRWSVQRYQSAGH